MKNRFINKCAGILLLFCMTGTMWAQKAGDVISGTVSDDFDVLAGAHVVEINKDNRVMASGITDVNGNFSFAIRNPQDRLQISYIGCVTMTIPIKGLIYNIMMEQDNHQLAEVEVKAKKRVQTSGLDIPATEFGGAMETISAGELGNLSTVTSVDEALQGRISGLDIVFASGNLGAGTSMRLRGVSTINGNAEPLIVVNGNVWESDANKDFDYNNPTDDKFAELLNVNPEDIESISVLKDASATAIWGSQGANGVIEIRTKRGSRGATRVTYSYRANVTYQPEGIQLLKGGEYTMFLKEAYFNPNFSDDAANIKEVQYLHSDAEFADWRQFNNDTDWRKAVTQVGLEQKHSFSVTGGGEKANFRVSAGYDHQTGSVIEQKLDRFTERTALDYNISDRIKVTTNFNFTYTNNNRNNGDLLGLAYKKMPNLAIYEEEIDGVSTGEFYHMKRTASPEFAKDQMTYQNPVALAKQAWARDKNFTIQPEFIINYDLMGSRYDDETSHLQYEGRVNFNITNTYNDTFYPASLVVDRWDNSNNNKRSSDSNKSFAMTTTHTLSYHPHFTNKDHSLSASVRFQLVSGNSRSQGVGQHGMPGNITSASGEGIIDKFGTGANEWHSLYLTGQAHYAYKGRYSAQFSVRRDGSNKFGRDARWGTFPGVSLRWNISMEPWMEWAENWLSMLSIRPGWGIVGNQPGQGNLYYAKYGTTQGYMGHTAIYPNNISLSSLHWEEKEQYNVGMDFGFFKDKLNIQANLYKSHTTDLLMGGFPLPSSSGFETLSTKNAGSMDNVGYELSVNTSNLITWGKDWKVDVNFTFANNQNKLASMDQTILDRMNEEFNFQNGKYLTHVQLHNAFGSIYGFRYKGVYQYSEYAPQETKGLSGPNAPIARNANGDPVLDYYGKTRPMYFAYGTNSQYEFKGGDAIYEDINHDGNINELDIVYLGSSLPKITGGFGINITWRRLTWNNQFNFRYGNKIINGARMNAESMYDNNNQSRAVNWRWRVEGDVTSIPRALRNAGYNWLGSDRFVEDGSFLRLNFSQIRYSLEPKVCKRLHVNSLSVFVQGSNVFCLTKYSGADPEVNYGGYGVTYDRAQTPRSKSFSAGLNVQF